MAGQSISNGARYGPRSAQELKKAKKMSPEGYYSLLGEAVYANQAPSIVGGKPKKGVALLEKMVVSFPDSVDIKIHLADGYHKVGKTVEARTIITPLLKTYPSNLFVKKVATKLQDK